VSAAPSAKITPSTPRYYVINQRTVDVSDIEQPTVITVTCVNDAPSSASGTATVYVLPSFGEF
jgi:hypothetical protein